MKNLRLGAYVQQAPGESEPDAVAGFEGLIGRQLGTVRYFFRWDADAFERAIPMLTTLGKAGRKLHLSFKPRLTDGTPVPWTQVASGAEDAVIGRFIMGLEALRVGGVRPWATFSHEADVDVSDSPYPQSLHLGTQDEFARAWRYFFNGCIGLTREVLVLDWWVDHEAFWPGDLAVDAFGIDAYCRPPHGGWHEVSELAAKGLEFARSKGVPLYITELGCVPDPRRPDWIRNGAEWLKANARDVRAVTYWNSDSTSEGFGDYRISNDPASLAAFRELALDPRFGRGGA